MSAGTISQSQSRGRIEVFQATYGERDRGHALLRSSGGDAPFSAIASLTDRPESAAMDLLQQPFVRAFAWESWYVLARTFQDRSASRTGMVFTHALLMRSEDVSTMSRLDALVRLLMDDIKRDQPLDPLVVDRDLLEEPHDRKNVSSLCVRVATALLTGPRLPVVWIGQENFVETICELWRYLWSSARLHLLFSLSFSPQDLEGQALTVVATPRIVANRWSDYSVIDPSRTVDESTAPNAHLRAALDFIFEEGRRGAVGEFFAALEAGPKTFTDVLLAARVVSMPCYSAFVSGRDVDAETLRSVARVVAKLSPHESSGGALKARLIEGLSSSTAVGNEDDVTALRNFEFAPFHGATERLQSAIGQWFATALAAPSDSRSTIRRDAGRVLLLAATEPGEWADRVRAATCLAFANIPALKPAVGRRTWEWMMSDPRVPGFLAPCIPAKTERTFADACPRTLQPDIANSVVEHIAIPRGWDVLAAAALSASRRPNLAFAGLRQLDITITRQAYVTLSERVPPSDTLAEALATGDQLVIEVAGDLCARHSELLSEVDPANARWLAIWAACVRRTGQVWRYIPDPPAALERLWTSHLTGSVAPDSLLMAIAASEYGSLLNYSRRAELWNKLPTAVNQAFVAATAKEWLRKVITGARPSLPHAAETSLRMSIVDERQVEDVLLQNMGSATEHIVFLFKALPGLSETLFRRWLTKRALLPQQLESSGASQLLGKLVSEREWRATARDLTQLAHDRPEFRVAAEETMHLLSVWSRIANWSWLAPPRRRDSDIWVAAADLGSELYPWGPGEHDVWQRAGGDPSLLPMRGSGRASWQAAIDLVRNGGGGERLTLERLLESIRKDFPQNDRVRTLQSLVKRRTE